VVGPFAIPASCPPRPRRCSGGASRSPARASRTVVRPGHKNGGTTLIFRLTRPATLRITIFRVYPSCKRIGSFSVRTHAGVNRVRFRGRMRGRALPPGGYRLVVRARGAERDAAAIPIVIARGTPSKAQVRKARTTVVCDEQVADLAVVAAPAPGATDENGGSGGSKLEGITKKVTDPVSRAAGLVVGNTRSLGESFVDPDDPLRDATVIAMLLLIVLASAALGLLLITHAARSAGLFDNRR
jgi:hypothetical protein